MTVQVNDFAADAIISQLLLLDSQDPNKVPCSPHDGTSPKNVDSCPESHAFT